MATELGVCGQTSSNYLIQVLRELINLSVPSLVPGRRGWIVPGRRGWRRKILLGVYESAHSTPLKWRKWGTCAYTGYREAKEQGEAVSSIPRVGGGMDVWHSYLGGTFGR